MNGGGWEADIGRAEPLPYAAAPLAAACAGSALDASSGPSTASSTGDSCVGSAPLTVSGPPAVVISVPSRTPAAGGGLHSGRSSSSSSSSWRSSSVPSWPASPPDGEMGVPGTEPLAGPMGVGSRFGDARSAG